MRPPMPAMLLSRRSKILLSVVAIIIVVLIVAARLTGVYVNWLWFGSLGLHNVYGTILVTRLVLFAIFGVAMALILGGNIALAYRLRPPFRPMSPEQQNLERYRTMIDPHRRLLIGVVMAISLLSAGMSAQGDWQTWQLFLHGGKFGVVDPLFGKDVSFYMWDYPAYRLLLGFGFTAIIFAIILSALVHYVSGAIRLQTPGPKVTPAARRHLTILIFVFIALKAVAYWMDRYGLVFSTRSKFTGASYTDVHSVLPSKTILFWIAIVLALVVLASLWLRSPLLPGIGFIVLIVLSILISGVYPAIVQQVSVKPNASTKEAPYIHDNIIATRHAYGLVPGKDVNYVPYTAVTNPKAAALNTETNATVGNLRILDPNLLSNTFAKFQQDGNVYGFPNKLDVDRYTLPNPTTGKPVTHDYIVSVRELDAANLAGDQTNWINKHTYYTHGYGFVAAQANEDVTNDGNKKGAFTAGGIPQSGKIDLKNPQVYYGELLPNYSIVGAAGSPQEFNGNGKTKVSYRGSGGVSLGNIINRLAFAVKYQQANLLLNDAASAKGARIIFNRDPRAMVAKAAPFLKVDSDPYPFVDEATGDITWMVDAYTTMNDYPYSERESLSSLTDDSLSARDKTVRQPNDSINYIRNSVKATVDAYTGKVTLYAWDASDPVLKAWMRIFPGLVEPKSDMSAAVLSHVRFPEGLFKVKRAMIGMYHMSNPVNFYNVTDKWTVPDDPTDPAAHQPPYYVLAAPPGGSQTSTQFQLISPMNVNNSTYLAAYLSVDNDYTGPNSNYGKMTVLQLPQGSSAVQGPEQIYNVITGNATITKDLSLFNSAGGGSNVLHGNLLTLPLGGSFLYVEPLYNQTSSGGSGTYPIMVRVIVVYGDRIGYGQTLSAALSDFQSGACTGHTLQSVTCSPGSGADVVPNGSGGKPGGTGGSSGSSGSPSSTPTNSPSTHSSPPSQPTSSAPVTGPSTPTQSSPTVPPTVRSSLAPVEKRELDKAYQRLQDAYQTGNQAKIGSAQQKLNQLVAHLLGVSTSALGSGSGSGSAGP